MRKVYHEKVGKHSKPSLVVGPKREFQKQERQNLLDRAEGKLPEVTEGDLEIVRLFVFVFFVLVLII